jgi:hypothetical protein
MTIQQTVGKHLLIITATLLLAGPALAGHGPGDGTGNDGIGPADGTGNGATNGDCASTALLQYGFDRLIARGGNGHGGDHGNGADNGGYGPGDGTGNGGDGPEDGTGYGPGTGDCVNG